jgi:hypothetical protein
MIYNGFTHPYGDIERAATADFVEIVDKTLQIAAPARWAIFHHAAKIHRVGNALERGLGWRGQTDRC